MSDVAATSNPALAVVAADELAARLAARLCHDCISPASAIVSGLDLLEDPDAKDMRQDAMNLIAASARKLVALLAFSRVAFGASAGAEDFGTAELERLAQGIFAHVRAELAWAIEPQALARTAARALLNLAQLAAGALPTGGTATAVLQRRPGRVALAVEARGPRARLHEEVRAGLAGEPLGEGPGGRWVQAYYLRVLVAAAGGTVAATAGEEIVTLGADLPD
ncbi:MAG TPA: histidine phosphotransferase family protein [Caulobacteraceae bacterium]|nr:histidine phosphotransferase family protein [Caulobacteraceae bacterium]